MHVVCEAFIQTGPLYSQSETMCKEVGSTLGDGGTGVLWKTSSLTIGRRASKDEQEPQAPFATPT